MSPSSRRRAAGTLAWIATTGAVFLAGWNWLAHGSKATYDPMLALTMVTAVGLIWYTYLTWATLDHSRQAAADTEQRKRESLATAILAELYHLTPRLRRFAEQASAVGGTPDWLSHPNLEVAAVDPSMFSARAIRQLTVLRRRTIDVQGKLRHLKETREQTLDTTLSQNAARKAQERHERAWKTMRHIAAGAHNAAARLVEILEAEGGALPESPEYAVEGLDDAPLLLPDPFDRSAASADSDDGKLEAGS